MFRYIILSVAITVGLMGCTTSSEVEEFNYTACEDGTAAGYSCDGIDFYAHLSIAELISEGSNSENIRLNDIWGWIDPETAQEYAIVGLTNGVSFVDVTNPADPIHIGNMPLTNTAQPSTWRDMKVHKNYVYVVADAARDHGMQIFDLTELRGFNNDPITFEETAFYDKISSAHNIVINEESGFAYAVGSNSGGETCGGGLHMISLEDPVNPEFAGCFADPSTGRFGTGYTHDAQCVIYNGPDEEHLESEICIGSNETAISVADVSDKDNPRSLSTASYPFHAYIHQGWLTQDHRYFFLNDESDEVNNATGTTTYIWDMEDLDNPELIGAYEHDTVSIDHNLYTKGDLMYQANYTSGLQILDISTPLPENISTLGSFNTTPNNNQAIINGQAQFKGLWSVYPYLSGDKVIVSDINNGLFILRYSQ